MFKLIKYSFYSLVQVVLFFLENIAIFLGGFASLIRVFLSFMATLGVITYIIQYKEVIAYLSSGWDHVAFAAFGVLVYVSAMALPELIIDWIVEFCWSGSNWAADKKYLL